MKQPGGKSKSGLYKVFWSLGILEKIRGPQDPTLKKQELKMTLLFET